MKVELWWGEREEPQKHIGTYGSPLEAARAMKCEWGDRPQHTFSVNGVGDVFLTALAPVDARTLGYDFVFVGGTP